MSIKKYLEETLLEDFYVTKLNNALEEDTEKDHIVADEILCELLRELGFDRLIDLYESFGKWYA